MIAAPQTFASKGRSDRWPAAKRTELDAETAVEDKAATGRCLNNGRLLAVDSKPQTPHPRGL
jgi:hypothetical protein